jgi:hypothetical protein
MHMSASGDELLRILGQISYVFTFLMMAVLGVAFLFYTVIATMSKLSKDQDDVEQLALKFSHRR